MRPARSPAELGLTLHDRRRLERALRRTRDARHFRRLLAVKLLADGWTVRAVSRLCELSRPAVYKWLGRYLEQRKVESLVDKPRSGRPPTARGLTGEYLAQQVRKSPQQLGYATHGWTVALLATHLRSRHGVEVSQRTLRRRMHAQRLRWKRPRYVYTRKAKHLPQKKGAWFAV